MIELMSKEIAQYSRRVSLGEDVGEDFLIAINQLQENTMIVRENAVDKQRMLFKKAAHFSGRTRLIVHPSTAL